MIAIYFVYGLAFFSLGLAVMLESRRASKLPLGQELPWLGAFGLAHSLVEWTDMFLMVGLFEPARSELLALRGILLPVSAVLLVRFGIGLIKEAGPLPEWASLAPVVLLVPAGLALSYGLIIAFTEPPLATAADVWSRYLLYFTGNLLAGYGFIRQWQVLPKARYRQARWLLLGAAVAFLVNAFVGGLVVPPAAYGLAAWLNYDTVLAHTGVPIQFWRMTSALAVAYFVVRTLDVFEAERKQQMAELDQARSAARQSALQSQSEARRSAEKWTDALVTISQQIANLEDVDSVLLEVVRSAHRLFQSDSAVIALWDETGERLIVKGYSGPTRDELGSAQQVITPLILQAVREGRRMRYPEDDAASGGSWRCPILGECVESAAIVPLRMEGRSIGGLWTARQEARPFTLDDLRALERLANQAVIAIEHALMAARLQSLAVIEERARIAREMHDGLAQILGYLGLEMQTLEALVRRGDQASALAELAQARHSIDQAHADVRENITSLRTTLSGEGGLIPALEQYVSEFGLQVDVQADLICGLQEPLGLSPLAQAQMVRVIQEALANVRKHARANRVQVRLSTFGGCLSATITDDGVGFTMPVEQGRFGLQTMRERAESVGGGLTITSRPGEGTQVELRLPLFQPSGR